LSSLSSSEEHLAKELLERWSRLSTVYDIVIGDFGREAATRYMALLAQEERRQLAPLLRNAGLPFLDEYRRIMFGLIGDVAFLKETTIQNVWASRGHLTDDVLVAIKDHDVPADMVLRLACLIRDQAQSATFRGHGRVRVTLLCNALSDTVALATRMASSSDEAFSAAGVAGYRLPGWDALSLDLSSYGVVESAVAQMARLGLLRNQVFVVLGAQMARDQYARVGGEHGMKVAPLTAGQQLVIDEAVVACVDGADEVVAAARNKIDEFILRPLREAFPTLMVLEACTDFDFGLGLDSLRLMAQHMIHDCYADLLKPAALMVSNPGS
jgi:hypothetical protein